MIPGLTAQNHQAPIILTSGQDRGGQHLYKLSVRQQNFRKSKKMLLISQVNLMQGCESLFSNGFWKIWLRKVLIITQVSLSFIIY